MQKPHMDFGMRDDSGLLTYIWKSVNMSSMVCDYITVRTTQLYRPYITIFIQFYYMFRLSISAISRHEYWLIKTAERGQVRSGLCLQTVDLTLRRDIPIVCYKYHTNEAELQSEHNQWFIS